MTRSLGPSRTLAALSFLAVLLEASFLWLRRSHPFDQNVVEVIGLTLLSGVFYLVAVFVVLQSSTHGRHGLWLVVVAALAFRATLFPLHPSLSTDLYRYLWEGRIQLAGHNPYLVAPAGPAGAGIPVPTEESLAGAEVTAAYGPAMELAFRFTALVDGVGAFKMLSLVFDLGTLLVLIRLLEVLGQPVLRALLYAWCPLVILEFSGSGHNDSLPLALLLLGNLFLITRQQALSMIALATALLGKWFAGVAAPLFLWRAHWRSVTLLLATGILFFLPYRSAGAKLVAGLAAYGVRWRNNESLYGVLLVATGEETIATGVAVGVVAGLALYLAARGREPLRSCLILLASVLFLAPCVFPWYVTWMVPFLCFHPHPALLLFTSTVLLSYHVLIDYTALGVWRYTGWLVWLEYLPVYGLLGWEGWRRARP
jgi:hypothetical protein